MITDELGKGVHTNATKSFFSLLKNFYLFLTFVSWKKLWCNFIGCIFLYHKNTLLYTVYHYSGVFLYPIYNSNITLEIKHRQKNTHSLLCYRESVMFSCQCPPSWDFFRKVFAVHWFLKCWCWTLLQQIHISILIGNITIWTIICWPKRASWESITAGIQHPRSTVSCLFFSSTPCSDYDSFCMCDHVRYDFQQLHHSKKIIDIISTRSKRLSSLNLLGYSAGKTQMFFKPILCSLLSLAVWGEKTGCTGVYEAVQHGGNWQFTVIVIFSTCFSLK